MTVKTCGCDCDICQDITHCSNPPCRVKRHLEPMRYGVQYQPNRGGIEAGPVARTADGDRFILKSDVTGYAIGAVAQWLIAHSKHSPYQITDKTGNTYELTARLIDEAHR